MTDNINVIGPVSITGVEIERPVPTYKLLCGDVVGHMWQLPSMVPMTELWVLQVPKKQPHTYVTYICGREFEVYAKMMQLAEEEEKRQTKLNNYIRRGGRLRHG